MSDFSKMNLSNKLTILRLILIIPFIFFFDMGLSYSNIFIVFFGRIFALSIFVAAIMKAEPHMKAVSNNDRLL